LSLAGSRGRATGLPFRGVILKPRPTPKARAAALRALAYTAYRAGNPARARLLLQRALDHFRQAGAAHDADALTTLSDLGAACAATGNHEAARAAHEAALQGRRDTLGDTHPDIGASLHNLAATWRALGKADEAEICQRQALAIWRETLGDWHPLTAKALAGMVALALDRGDAPAALVHAQEALSVRMDAPVRVDAAIAAALEDLGAAHAAAGDHRAACEAFTQALTRPSPRAASLHVRSGVSRRILGDLAAAAAHFGAAIGLDPSQIAARHQLASTLIRLGRADEATAHRHAALQAQPVFVQPGPHGAPRVLILATAEPGNIPLDHMLPEARHTRIWWFIGDAGPGQTAASLPDHDVLFNGEAACRS
jgi:tetratricopeptide (TPR) repeat protein